MKKKIMAIILAAAAAVGLCGCKGGEKKDWDYIQSKGELVVGITYFKPMNYFDDNTGELTGFETEFTTAVCEKLGVKPKFQEINWDNKVFELDAKTIDVIWNGMTVKADLAEKINFSTPYIRNRQVAVIKKANADKYKDLASMAGASVTAEIGSAGETAVQADENLSKNYNGSAAQKDVLMEIKAGTTEIGVIDYVMAKASVGDGTDYSDLMIVENVNLAPEEYAVGIRKDDVELQKKINAAIDEMVKDGSLKALCEKYDLADVYAFN
ncbi:MAG: transporter substrate-binding domain-containing protein [Oscillospiraceae bacterium]